MRGDVQEVCNSCEKKTYFGKLNVHLFLSAHSFLHRWLLDYSVALFILYFSVLMITTTIVKFKFLAGNSNWGKGGRPTTRSIGEATEGNECGRAHHCNIHDIKITN